MPEPEDPEVAALGRSLRERTAEGRLYERIGEGAVRCLACGHRCRIGEGREGICKVRFNEAGTLRVPRGYVAGLAVDPIEKKPFFHVLPGADAVSFGMLGCDLHCPYCQNWTTSQTLRDEGALAAPRDVSAEEIVAAARRRGAPAIVSTYNEPLITIEWAVEIFALARPEGILCGFVSNGNATPEALDFLRPHASLFKIDLKSFRDASYRELGGRLETVIETIREAHRRGFWVEVVTLVVPGFNDSREELREIAAFLASVSPLLPWHVTAYRPDYRVAGGRATTPDDLRRAAAIGREAGLGYVYAGNAPGRVGDLESTRCHACGHALIERSGYAVRRNAVGPDGRCPSCDAEIPGVWRRPAIRTDAGT